MIRVRGREDIIRHIRSHIIRVVAPLDAGRHLTGIGYLDAFLENFARVDIALDLVFAAGPLPGGAPSDARASATFKVGALGA